MTEVLAASVIHVVYTTVGSLKEAEQLGLRAVESHHAACVNIVPGVLSIYEWLGKVEKTPECIVLFKTTQEQGSALVAWLEANHPYELPAIVRADVSVSHPFWCFVNRQPKEGTH